MTSINNQYIAGHYHNVVKIFDKDSINSNNNQPAAAGEQGTTKITLVDGEYSINRKQDLIIGIFMLKLIMICYQLMIIQLINIYYLKFLIKMHPI